MRFSDWWKIQTNRAKMLAWLLKKVPQMLAAAGLAGYVSTRDLQKWIQNNIIKFIPTKIDDKIIEFDQEFEDKYLVPKLDDIAHALINDFRGDRTFDNLNLEIQNIRESARITDNHKKAARQATMWRDALIRPHYRAQKNLKEFREMNDFLKKDYERKINKIGKSKEKEKLQTIKSGFHGGRDFNYQEWLKQNTEQQEKESQLFGQKGFP